MSTMMPRALTMYYIGLKKLVGHTFDFYETEVCDILLYRVL
jgi:hypothetical protein